MAYNAGEYRVLGALRRSGQVARNAKPEKLAGLSRITHAYVRKLHALSCLLDQADDRDEWLRALDRPSRSAAVRCRRRDSSTLGRAPAGCRHLRRLNPAFATAASPGRSACACSHAVHAPHGPCRCWSSRSASDRPQRPPRTTPTRRRSARHIVARGESAGRSPPLCSVADLLAQWARRRAASCARACADTRRATPRDAAAASSPAGRAQAH